MWGTDPACGVAEVKRLLSETDLRVSDVAQRCGCAPGVLNNLFRRHFGLSMRAWHQSHRL